MSRTIKLTTLVVALILLVFSLCEPWYCIFTVPTKSGTFIGAVIIMTVLSLALLYVYSIYSGEESTSLRPSKRKVRTSKVLLESYQHAEKIVAVILTVLFAVCIVVYIALA